MSKVSADMRVVFLKTTERENFVSAVRNKFGDVKCVSVGETAVDIYSPSNKTLREIREMSAMDKYHRQAISVYTAF